MTLRRYDEGLPCLGFPVDNHHMAQLENFRLKVEPRAFSRDRTH